MAFNITLLLIEIALSAFFSASETALFSLRRHELARFSHDRRPSRRLVANLMKLPRKLLLTLMAGNVTINMLIFATGLVIFQKIAGADSMLGPVLGLVIPLMVTLLGDIVPKGTSIVFRKHVALGAAPLVQICQKVLSPATFLLNAVLVEPLTRLLIGGRRPHNEVTIEELAALVEMSQHQQIIDADENAMLSGVIQLGELRVRNIMVPRVDIIAFDIQDDVQELHRVMRERQLPKIPVYDGDIDRTLGLIYAKDLFLRHDRSLRQLIKPVKFVPEMISLTQLLNHFRQTRTQMAMAVDEYGGIVGLVSLEDVAEEIVGELSLPGDAANQNTWERIDERNYRISGRVSVHDWAEQFDIRRFDQRVTTLAGLIVAHLGRLPVVGDQISLGNIVLTVESLQGHRIDWIRLELNVAVSEANTTREIGGQGQDSATVGGGQGQC